jgi:hypothetical protein
MHKIIIAIASSLALTGATAGVTLAATSSSPSFVLACYANKKPHVMIHRTGPRCPSGYTSIIWSVQGPRGAKGPRGDVGPAGPSTAGPSGLDVIMEEAQISDGAYGVAVDCPPDHPYVIGGGYAPTGNPASPLEAVADQPVTTNPPTEYWSVTMNGPTTSSNGVTVYALCAK